MPEQTTSSIVIDATVAQVMAVIVDFEAYPAWAQGMKEVHVVTRDASGRAETVHFDLEAAPIKDSYTLAYRYEGDETLRWTLAEGKMLRGMEGSYELAAAGNGTRVTYQLSVDVAIPMIGLLRRKAEKVIIDTALKGLKKRVESLG
ncbi:carbon monoxide dehydrogenase subunit G [Marmoricola sp. OAE513]|uniref:SRPBCC family protein n=1 Tax=Marmoricola sp. OAE513 TaxID=2817894 RepID=UPI001AEB687C